MRIFLVLVLLSAAAHADRRTYTRQTAVPRPVTPTATKAAPAKPPVPAKPAVTADAILKQDEDNQPIYVEQEAILEQLVKDTPDADAEKADLMFRLAEHYAKQWRFWRIEEDEKRQGRP